MGDEGCVRSCVRNEQGIDREVWVEGVCGAGREAANIDRGMCEVCVCVKMGRLGVWPRVGVCVCVSSPPTYAASRPSVVGVSATPVVRSLGVAL